MRSKSSSPVFRSSYVMSAWNFVAASSPRRVDVMRTEHQALHYPRETPKRSVCAASAWNPAKRTN